MCLGFWLAADPEAGNNNDSFTFEVIQVSQSLLDIEDQVIIWGLDTDSGLKI